MMESAVVLHGANFAAMRITINASVITHGF
jgi:hypothetical protein